ncbi:dynein intermediate chain 2 [Culex quinquefasciatus]|uniref:Dynein intermediate chain 2 n=2 Tax=Culex pipiens complex TaxID=518105 RepID=B0WLC7_CULQU|nr:dynein intermediate chain 3, ciliary [Culex quinquefasciatus]XP_039436182.1 dynein intermediate chain 3, ciliary-like [Culex pipiens pallens]EDS30420.1 dynein intermediate chain 2 [Culex quinquefasciatus]|eukprot:XP_001849511.1 dynein intermediate chain 2 [Culex quinquefasciatus]
MDIEYAYQKERREFGRQCLFSDKNKVEFTEAANHEFFKEYILRDPVHLGTQYSRQMSLSAVNTESAEFENRGILHSEGGWPKDVNYLDPEQTVRYRRKIEKDENYVTQLTGLTKPMEHCIYQNNAVNIYENYFEGLDPAPLMEKSSSRTLNVYRDPAIYKQPVTHLSWSPDGGSKIAVSHCNMNFREASGKAVCSYIWETENPNAPLLRFTPHSSMICLEYNQKDPTTLVSGMYNGQVAAWDTRNEKAPVMISEREHSHRSPVNSTLWINSKSGTEFFSGSSDSQVMWWDTRKLSQPIDTLLMDPIKSDEQDLSRSYGVSCLEYETSIPTRFMCGTEQGMLFSCNRKGKSPQEKIVFRLQCHTGPIYSLTRNPAFVKNFLTIGDWIARIWSEDCRESSIIWTKHHSVMLTDGVWNPTRYSIFYVSRVDGVLDAWDLLQQQSEPILSIKVCDESLKCLRAHEAGYLVGAGSTKGATFLLEMSDNMTSIKNDKPLLTAMLERENRREKILEAKSREMKLKVRTLHRQEDTIDERPKLFQCKSACDAAEQEYLQTLEKERKARAPEEYDQEYDPRKIAKQMEMEAASDEEMNE